MDRPFLSIGTTIDEAFYFSSPDDLDLELSTSDGGLWEQSITVDQEEQLYNLHFYPECGEVIQTVQLSPIPERVRHLRRLLNSTGAAVAHVIEAATPNFIINPPRQQSTSPGRAFNQVRRRMMQAALTTHARLGYETQPPLKTIKRDIAKFTARLRKKHKNLHYVAVLERGPLTGALHWHVALPFFVGQDEIEAAWIRGGVFVTRMHDHESMERFVAYITKTFWLDAGDRELPHRYKRDKKLRIRRQLHEGLTQAEVDIFLEQIIQSTTGPITFRESSHPWVTAAVRWCPQHLEEALSHDLNM